MEGLTKAINELGTIIVAKDVEIEMQRKEIEKMQKKIESIQQYIEMYEEFFDYEQYLKRDKGE